MKNISVKRESLHLFSNIFFLKILLDFRFGSNGAKNKCTSLTNNLEGNLINSDICLLVYQLNTEQNLCK